MHAENISKTFTVWKLLYIEAFGVLPWVVLPQFSIWILIKLGLPIPTHGWWPWVNYLAVFIIWCHVADWVSRMAYSGAYDVFLRTGSWKMAGAELNKKTEEEVAKAS
jgi:hypothetical protein